MKDILNRNDIELLVNTFYQKVRQDTTIGYWFEEIGQVDWEHHLPRMYDFWETTLFGKAVFKGNPMLKHILLSKKAPFPLNESHFSAWLKLWHETIDELFSGENADGAKQKAQSIATLMLFKVQNHS